METSVSRPLRLASGYRVGFAVLVLAMGYTLTTSFALVGFSTPGSVRLTDLQRDSTPFYGRPLITIGAIPFDVNTPVILRQFEVSIGSWLRCTAQVVVHLYDVVGGMGNLSDTLIGNLQREFGRDRVLVAGTIVKKGKIETIPEAFSAVEANTTTQFSAWFSNDMILPMNWMDYVFAAMRYFKGYDNYSMHFARRDLQERCRANISLENVASPDWPEFSADFFKQCKARLHTLGYDCYLWNHVGINMTKSGILPFYIGRPNFDGAIIWKQMQQGWFITAYPELLTYHLEHPDRIQYAKKRWHPDSQYNIELSQQEGGHQWRNEQLDLRLSLTHVMERKDGRWVKYDINRPPNVFPLTNPMP